MKIPWWGTSARPVPEYARSTDLAVVYDEARQEAAVASYANTEGSPLVVERFACAPDDAPLAHQVHAWRHTLGLDVNPAESAFLIVPQSFTERTRQLWLPDEARPLDDAEFLAWLLHAADNNTLGLDEQPLFDEPLEVGACDYTRQADGQAALTEAAWADVTASSRRLLDAGSTVALLERLPLDQQPHLALRVETLVRAFVRAFWEARPLLVSHRQPHSVTAFYVATEKGVSIGLWSWERGLFHEFAEAHTLPGDLEAWDDEAAYPALAELQTGAATPLAAAHEAELRQQSLCQAAQNLALRLHPTRLKESGVRDVGGSPLASLSASGT